MLTDIAKEGGDGHRTEPVEVVHLDRWHIGVIEIHETRKLPPQPARPFTDLLLGMQHALTDVPGVADQPGSTARQQHGSMSRVLETSQHEHLHEMTGVQAGRGGIEPGIDSERAAIQIPP